MLGFLIGLSGLLAAMGGALALFRSGKVPGTVPYWTRALSHSNRRDRLKTVVSLSQVGTPSALYCLTLAARQEYPEIKKAALKGLLLSRSPSVLNALASALRDRDASIRQMVALGLGRFKDPRVIPMLTDLLNDLDDTVISAATETLGAKGDPQATVALGQALAGGPETARLAGQALVAIGMPAFEPLCRLIPVLSPPARERLIPILIEMNPQGSLEPLVNILFTADVDFLIKATVSGLLQLKNPAAITPLIDFVSDERHMCRPYALRALQVSPEPAVKALLVRLLEDRDVQIRRAAAEALAANFDVTLIEPLLKALNDSDPEVMLSVIQALGNYQDPRIFPELFQLLWPQEYETLSNLLRRSSNKPIEEIASIDEFMQILRRISGRESRGSEEQQLRHYLQSLIILLRHKQVIGFHDLTATLLVFRENDFTSDLHEDRLHPLARKILKFMPDYKALHNWKIGRVSS